MPRSNVAKIIASRLWDKLSVSGAFFRCSGTSPAGEPHHMYLYSAYARTRDPKLCILARCCLGDIEDDGQNLDFSVAPDGCFDFVTHYGISRELVCDRSDVATLVVSKVLYKSRPDSLQVRVVGVEELDAIPTKRIRAPPVPMPAAPPDPGAGPVDLDLDAGVFEAAFAGLGRVVPGGIDFVTSDSERSDQDCEDDASVAASSDGSSLSDEDAPDVDEVHFGSGEGPG